MKSQALPHLPALDGVRGLAVVLVILFHSALIPPVGLAAKVLHKVTLTGWIGVDLFFVLSGFLITRILLHQKGRSNYFLNFYMRRVLRLFPLYYLFLVLFLIVFPEKVQFDFTYWLFLSNILIGRLGQFQSGVLDVTWSLAVEEQFYLLWPALVFLLSKEKLKKLAIALFFLAFFIRLSLYEMGAHPMKSYVLLPCRWDALSVGAFLACSDLKFSLRRIKTSFLCLLALVILVFSFGFNFNDPLMRTLGYSLNALWAGSIITLVIGSHHSFLKKFFQIKILRHWGKYSYAMYLFHVPVIHFLSQGGRTFWSLGSSSPAASFLIQMLFHALSVLATGALAVIIYQAFEKHFLKLKNLFSYSSDSASPSPLSQSSSLN